MCLMTYGTGAIMAVPAHDDPRLGVRHASSACPSWKWWPAATCDKAAYTDIQDGVMVNSGFLNGLKVAQAKKAIGGLPGGKGPTASAR